MSLCRAYLQKFAQNPESPVCRLPKKQKLCDAANLGRLVQAFPELRRPQVEDDQYGGSISELLSRMGTVAWYGAEITYEQT